jgi:hypothetical protein
VRLPSGSILAVGLAAAIAGLAALQRRRWRQHRHPADPFAADPPRRRLPAAVTAAEAAWLGTQRPTAASDDDSDVIGDQGIGEADDPLDGPLDRPLDGLLDGLLVTALDGPPDRTEFDAEAGRRPGPEVRSDADVGSVGTGRGLSAGGLPAPSLLDLVGQPAGRVLAQRVWAGGAGVTGPGAAGAARAVLARLLSASGPLGGQLLTTTTVVAQLLPAEAIDGFTRAPGVRVFLRWPRC